jgi:hypothetical protein
VNGAKARKLAELTERALSTGLCGEKLIEEMISTLEPDFRWKEMSGAVNTMIQVPSGELPAITEPIMNSIDAACRLKAMERAAELGLPASGPEFDGMFRSQRHLTEELFGVPKGELALWRNNAQGYSYDWLASHVASLILENGDAANLTIKILDFRGCGQAARRFRRTFLNIGVGDKGDRLWESGTYGIGGAVLARIGKYQLIVSRRAPSIAESGDEAWGIIIMRSERRSNKARDYRTLSVLARGADGDPDEFPTLPIGTELHGDESYSVDHLDHRPDEAEVADIVLAKAALFEASRGEAAEMRAEVLAPPKAKAAGCVVRVIARRRLTHGTARVIVGTNFTESWITGSIAGKGGVRRRLEMAIPDPILPFLLVENRFAPGEPSPDTGKDPCEPVLGRTLALSKCGRTLDRIPVDISIDGVELGAVEASLTYSPDMFSEAMTAFARVPRLIRSGQLVDGGDGAVHEFASMFGNAGFIKYFACLVSLDGLRNDCDRLTKLCTAARTAGNSDNIRKMWKRVAEAVNRDPRVRGIVEELRQAMPEPDEYAKQLSRVLGGRGGTGVILSPGPQMVPVCVKGSDMPRTGAKPDYVYVDVEPRFSKKERTLETLRPVKVQAGKTKSFTIRTSSARRIGFAKKGCPYTLEVYVDGSGVSAKVTGSRLVVAAAKPRLRPTTVWVYATGDSGFVSTPGVVKVLPTRPRPAPAVSLLPEPTFVRAGSKRLELPVGKAQEIRLRTDAEQSFRGFHGGASHNGHTYPVRVRPDGPGRLRALVPALQNARPGDACVLGVSANGVALCSIGLVVVDRQTPPGPVAPPGRNPMSVIYVPGQPDGLPLRFADEKDPPEAWGFLDSSSPAQICLREDKHFIVINHLAPAYMESVKHVEAELKELARREHDPSERERLERLTQDYDCRMAVAGRDQMAELGHFADRSWVPNPDAGDYMEKSAMAMRRVARVLPLMTHVDLNDFFQRFSVDAAPACVGQ